MVTRVIHHRMIIVPAASRYRTAATHGRNPWISGQFHWTASNTRRGEYHGAGTGEDIIMVNVALSMPLIPTPLLLSKSVERVTPMVHVSHIGRIPTSPSVRKYQFMPKQLRCSRTLKMSIAWSAKLSPIPVWLVPWQPGRLAVIGYRQGQEVARLNAAPPPQLHKFHRGG